MSPIVHHLLLDIETSEYWATAETNVLSEITFKVVRLTFVCRHCWQGTGAWTWPGPGTPLAAASLTRRASLTRCLTSYSWASFLRAHTRGAARAAGPLAAVAELRSCGGQVTLQASRPCFCMAASPCIAELLQARLHMSPEPCRQSPSHHRASNA